MKFIKANLVLLQKVTSKFKLDDIYNFDETALFYRFMPNNTLADKNISGIKNHKDRLTIGVISNANDSDKPK